MGCSQKLHQNEIILKYSNYIICEHNITNEFLGKKIRIMNHDHENYKLIPQNVDIYINPYSNSLIPLLFPNNRRNRS